MSQEKIIFLGTPEISAVVLEGLVRNGFNVVGAVTKEDKIRDRSHQPEPSPVALMAEKLGVPVHKPHKLNLDYQFLIDKKPDLLLTFAYGQLISDTILAIPAFRPLNLHASLLPKYRGAAPIQYALRNGEKETGVTLMEMVHEMDAGPIYAVERLPIDPKDNYTVLADKLAKTALSLALHSLPLFFEGKLSPVVQDAASATFCPSIKKEEEKLNLRTDPVTFVNQVRSLSFVPGGYLLFGEENLKIFAAEPLNDTVSAPAGTIIKAEKKDIILQLAKGQVRILELQRPGKKRLSATDFNNGVHGFTSCVLR